MDAIDRLYGEDVVDGLRDQDAKSFRENCNCLIGCQTIFYDVEIDRSLLELDQWTESYSMSNHATGVNVNITK